MPSPKDHVELRNRHFTEVEASQAGLRESIGETDRLVEEADEMLKRHRKECEEADAATGEPEVG